MASSYLLDLSVILYASCAFVYVAEFSYSLGAMQYREQDLLKERNNVIKSLQNELNLLRKDVDSIKNQLDALKNEQETLKSKVYYIKNPIDIVKEVLYSMENKAKVIPDEMLNHNPDVKSSKKEPVDESINSKQEPEETRPAKDQTSKDSQNIKN